MYEALIGRRNDVSQYAWIITKDHLSEDYPSDDGIDEVDTMGPGTAPDDLIALLESGKGRVFRMYDDDGELYYTGRLVTRTGDMGAVSVSYESGMEDEIDPCYAPLRDFGGPGAGCTLIKWANHPEWDCEY